jgi:hypothetical protein
MVAVIAQSGFGSDIAGGGVSQSGVQRCIEFHAAPGILWVIIIFYQESNSI